MMKLEKKKKFWFFSFEKKNKSINSMNEDGKKTEERDGKRSANQWEISSTNKSDWFKRTLNNQIKWNKTKMMAKRFERKNARDLIVKQKFD